MRNVIDGIDCDECPQPWQPLDRSTQQEENHKGETDNDNA
ncbi:hypothetical protein [Arthronema virus TR020]|uniref:Uncharacterized protein n=1 Tax=Arthronema virus TR020 TaxID=2736280 RepID=A0A7G3WH36_9CAUD|nr:hypothetical protein [Arthronema virus TR020]